MPLRALSRIHARLSGYFYPYGKACTFWAVPLLLFSLASICLLSYPIVLDLLRRPSSLTSQLDAYFWQFSPHLQISNFTSPGLIIQQIRLANYDGRVDADLFDKADVLQKALTTTFVHVNGKPASLASICLLREGHCALQSPLLHYRAEQQGIVSTAAGGDPVHPYSVFGNVTFENNNKDYLTADSLILTIILKRSSTINTERVWYALWNDIVERMGLAEINNNANDDDGVGVSHSRASAWQKQINVQTQNMQYKYKHLIYQMPWQAYLCMFIVLSMCYLMSQVLGNAHLVKSQLALGTAAAIMPAACLTTTMGICRLFNIDSHLVPWYLKIVIPIVGCIENVFVLTNAVLSAGCDMQIKEKIGRALESLGVPMTVVLCLELTITALGAAMGVPKIKQFCVFAAVALIVDYVLDITFFLAVLSLDVNRVELTDLDDREMSKRLHELAKCDIDADQAAEDYCPVQEPPNENAEPKTCAECKHFKTYRTMTSLFLCLIILTQFSLRHLISNEPHATQHSLQSSEELHDLSSKFWNMVNPLSEPLSLQINAPYIILFAPTHELARQRIQEYEMHYMTASLAMQAALKVTGNEVRENTRFERIVIERMQCLVTLLLKVNIPSLLLCIVLVCLIVWLTPPWREQWLLPLLKAAFVKTVNHITYYVRRFMQYSPKGLARLMSRDMDRYGKDGVHRGAISVQSQFNKSQNRKNVQVKTLSGKHIADIQRIAVNAKHGTAVSCGQDGRIVLWNTDNAEWMARLDRVGQSSGGLAAEDLNPSYWTSASRPMRRQYSGRGQSKRMPSARCVKIDQGNRWIASGFDDGVIRVWNMSSGSLVRELHVETEMPVALEDEERNTGYTELRRRRQEKTYDSSSRSRRQRIVDRVVALQFIGSVAEYCHPLVAEAAARQSISGPSFDDNFSQNYLVSAHKSGTIREWDILSGECIKSISSGHTKDITALHVVECKAPRRKLGVTWIFTASKDGTVKSWERRLQKNEGNVTGSVWSCMYSLNGHNAYPITSLATESPVGGMGALVSGSSDGTVKVWNFETGEAVCTLSTGGLRRNKEPEVHVGGPLLKINKLDLSSSDVDVETDEASGKSISNNTVAADHTGSITQVVIARYCEVENGPGHCRGCDTCFGNGFLVASCATDDKVHVWRLERADGGHEHSCTLCSQDYHRKKYTRQRKSSQVSAELQDTLSSKLDTDLGAIAAATAANRRKRIRPAIINRPSPSGGIGDMFRLEPALAEDQLLDIEQLGGERDTTLAPSFLGEIDQLAGRGLVFCDKNVLAGVRKKPHTNEWEAWFAALQYYEPSASEQKMIPVQAIDLEQSTTSYADTTKQQQQNNNNYTSNRITDQILRLFGLYKRPKKQPMHSNKKKSDDLLKRIGDEEEEEEANELLPFSVVRHIVPLDGSGLGCDYGNFIKLVYLDDACRAKQLNFAASHRRGVAASKTTKEAACDCGGDCCGGTKSDCSHSAGHKSRKNLEKKLPASLRPTACNVADCAITNCPRASECAAVAGAAAYGWNQS